MPPKITIDDSASGAAVMTGGAGLGGFIDESALSDELAAKNKNYGGNRGPMHPIRTYIMGVIRDSGVPDAQATRELSSHICGVVARLPFCPDDETQVDGKTDFERQVIKTARRATEFLDSEMDWTSAAMKLSRTALERRKLDPDGKLGLAWVNDPLPGEAGALAAANAQLAA